MKISLRVVLLFIFVNNSCLSVFAEQYLYNVPRQSYSNERSNDSVHGPIIATPEQGSIKRWDERLYAPNSLPAKQQEMLKKLEKKTDGETSKSDNVAKNVKSEQDVKDNVKNQVNPNNENVSNEELSLVPVESDQKEKITKAFEEINKNGRFDAYIQYNDFSNSAPKDYVNINNKRSPSSAKNDQNANSDSSSLANSSDLPYTTNADVPVPENNVKNIYNTDVGFSVTQEAPQKNDIEYIPSAKLFDKLSEESLQKGFNLFNKFLRKKESETKKQNISKEKDKKGALQKDLDDATRYLLFYRGSEGPKYEEGKRVVYIPTDKQKQAIDLNLPSVPFIERFTKQTQIPPPNIAQKIYHGSNTHLAPVVFQNEIDGVAFAMTEHNYDLSKLQSLLNKISSIDVQTNDGNTLLMNSIANNNIDAVLTLIQNGANVNIANKFGVTPLHLATYYRNYRIMSILIYYNAKLDETDINCATPLMYAVMNSDDLATYLLVENGSNIDYINEYGYSVVDFAKIMKNNSILNYIKDKSLKYSQLFNKEVDDPLPDNSITNENEIFVKHNKDIA